MLRIRRRLNDVHKVQVSSWELLEAVNDALRELRKIVLQYFRSLTFGIPEEGDVSESSVTGWPIEFDELITNYCIYSLSGLSIADFEQVKMLWQSKVVAQAGTMDTSLNTVKSCFDVSDDDHNGVRGKQRQAESMDKRIHIVRGYYCD